MESDQSTNNNPLKSGSNCSALHQDTKPAQDVNRDHTKSIQDMKQNSSSLKTLNFQIGGHRHDHQKPGSKDGMFDKGNGMVLKTLQPPPRGLCELNFYKEVFHPECVDQDILELREFLPSFYGTEEREDNTFLKLANLMMHVKKPCVADLKIGQITYDRYATPEKVRTEKAKVPDLKEVGFQFIGMMIHDNDKPVYYKKPYCRSLTKDTIASKGLGCYFSILHEDRKREVIRQLVTRLQKIESWFLRQKKFSFIASSLLIIYEGFNASLPFHDLKSHCDKSSTNSISNMNRDLPPNQRSKELSGAVPDVLMSTNAYSGLNVQNAAANGPITNQVKNVKRSFDDEDGVEHHSESTDKTKRRKSDVLDDSDFQADETCDETKSERRPLITAHMIDFAHVFPGSEIDQNYLFGLQKFIHFLKDMLK